ncbi:MAG: cache domain-containing protein [Lachnospiraceae bacterium]|nr:cache domain-containing protein [Lachnospiraceae bacterium]
MKKKGKGIDMLKMLLMFGLLPLIVATVVICVEASSLLKNETEEMVQDKLLIANEQYNSYVHERYAEFGEEVLTGSMKSYDYVDSYLPQDVNFTVFLGDTRVLTSIKDDSGKRVEGTQAGAAVISAVLNGGQHYVAKDVDILGKKYYVDYLPLKDADGKIIGMTFAGEKNTAVSEAVNKLVRTLILIAAIIIIIAAAGIIFIALKVRKASVDIAENLKTMTSGNLHEEINAKSGLYENRIMIENLKEMQKHLGTTINGVKGNASSLNTEAGEVEGLSHQSADSAGQISQAVDDLAQGAMSMAESVEHVNGKVIDMGYKVNEIGENVQALTDNADRMRSASSDASTCMDRVLNSSKSTVESVDSINKQILLTNDSINKINEAINLIISIANQTQLLSLNASIEAARAGEAGRGFAVVATNISELSEQSNDGASTIREIAEEILKNSEESVQLSEKIKLAIEEEQKAIVDAQDKFAELNVAIGESVEEIGSIGEKTASLEDIKSSIVSDVQDLSAISEENAASTEEVTASVQSIAANVSMIAEKMSDINGMSTDLDDMVGFFS